MSFSHPIQGGETLREKLLHDIYTLVEWTERWAAVNSYRSWESSGVIRSGPGQPYAEFSPKTQSARRNQP